VRPRPFRHAYCATPLSRKEWLVHRACVHSYSIYLPGALRHYQLVRRRTDDGPFASLDGPGLNLFERTPQRHDFGLVRGAFQKLPLCLTTKATLLATGPNCYFWRNRTCNTVAQQRVFPSAPDLSAGANTREIRGTRFTFEGTSNLGAQRRRSLEQPPNRLEIEHTSRSPSSRGPDRPAFGPSPSVRISKNL